MRINTKLAVALSILCLFVIVSGIVGLVYTNIINEKLSVVTATSTPLVETIDDIVIALLEQRVVVEKIVSASDTQTIPKLEKQFEAFQKNFEKASVIAMNLVNDGNLSKKLDDAQAKHAEFSLTVDEILYMKRQGKEKQEINSLKSKAEEQVIAAINTLEEIAIRAYAFNKEANQGSVEAVSATLTYISITTLLSLVSALAIGAYLSRSLLKPINKLSEAAVKVSGGQFDVELDEPQSDADEIDHLTIVFMKMVQSLEKLVKESPGLKKYIDLPVKEGSEKDYKLSKKSTYLIKDATPHRAYDLFSERVTRGTPGLCITRENPERIREKYSLADVQWIWLTETKEKGFMTTSQLDTLLKRVREFVAKHQSSTILVDRVDYLVTKHGFEAVMKFFVTFNDIVNERDVIALVPVDPACMDARSMTLLEKELKDLPSPTIKEEVPEELMKILSFIKNSKSMKRPVSFKDVGREFNITAPTTKRKISELEERRLVRIVKQGRNKLLEPNAEAEKYL